MFVEVNILPFSFRFSLPAVQNIIDIDIYLKVHYMIPAVSLIFSTITCRVIGSQVSIEKGGN